MKKLLAVSCFLLAFALGAHAQRRPLPGLLPKVVSLDSGLVLRRPLVGIDPVAYAQLRAERAADRRVHELDSLNLLIASREIARQSKELAGVYELLRLKTEEADKLKAGRAPFLPAYSAGFGSGFLAGLFIGFKFLPH